MKLFLDEDKTVFVISECLDDAFLLEKFVIALKTKHEHRTDHSECMIKPLSYSEYYKKDSNEIQTMKGEK